jgi:hypothetical protein
MYLVPHLPPGPLPHPPPLAVYALAQAASMTLHISLLDCNPFINDHAMTIPITILGPSLRKCPLLLLPLYLLTLHRQLPHGHLQQPQHHNQHLIIHPPHKSHSHSHSRLSSYSSNRATSLTLPLMKEALSVFVTNDFSSLTLSWLRTSSPGSSLCH